MGGGCSCHRWEGESKIGPAWKTGLTLWWDSPGSSERVACNAQGITFIILL